MLKTLAWKEFRELMPFVALALLAEIYLVSMAMGAQFGLLSNISGRDTETIPFVEDHSCTLILLAAQFFAIAIGLWQTMWEAYRGTFQFLLHRRLDRKTQIGVKLAVGMGLSLLVAILPLLFYALWAAMPGTHDSPFAWSMTWQSWFACCQIPLLYIAAFLSGLRPARLFVSRIFPIFACIFLIEFSEFLWPVMPEWQMVIVAVTIVLEALGILAVLNEAKVRDFS
jgi:hypothetical protein